jgi:hypothetical protein
MATLTFDTKTIIDTLLGKDVTPETIDLVKTKLDTIVLPWRPDRSSPPDYHRVTASGTVVATVTARLGGFADCHRPRERGWGYRVDGYGCVIHGIEEVDFSVTDPEKTIQAAERAALLAAMQKIDTFLEKERPNLRLLEEPLQKGKF